ncbi:unnamed protein product [Peronospora belbahrii]|uniref:Uncharacterized protein n=1 Tax=Peronospora belbahrii TaxID=622444 RepID=A0AAU9KZ18_9STRA|nr:unnamed protein product [Peronospora belbahrii]
MMSASSGKLGQLELSRLHKRRRIIDFAPVASAEAFWSEEIQTQANAISDEAVFDAFITPFFSNVLHNCAEPVLKQVDAEVLTRSILRVFQSDLLHSTLNQSIDNYGRSATQENINHWADQVYQNLA